ncbi:MAG: hypothetical protein M4579_002960 [Chaenotheca gracillima]|nr:MAG: hypothetical protein M4579_002960 [Chaenotheca gracillima]
MALFNPTFILGVLVLFYLSSFVLFALLRTITGISIQRIGYNSLRHIAYTPRDGIRLDIRGLGFVVHRPTFAQPTWVSLVLEELHVTVDLKALGGDGHRHNSSPGAESPVGEKGLNGAPRSPPPSGTKRASVTPGPKRSRIWQQMMDIKEKIKRLHRKINWLRVIDLHARNSGCTIEDVGKIQFGNLTMAVDTRRRLEDRSRELHQDKIHGKDQRPAEWIFTVKSVLFTPEGKAPVEILDVCTLNVHGFLYKELDGLRDTRINLKLGRLYIPYDDLSTCSERMSNYRKAYEKSNDIYEDVEISLTDVMDELGVPGSREERIMQAVSDSKEFVSSILRGIQEVQFAVSFARLSSKVRSVQPSGRPLHLNFEMKEIGMDLHRLDSKSPAHRMYFPAGDVAHQALFAALGLSLDVDDCQNPPERLIYVPMATTTIKTTLPSKTVEFDRNINVAERNTNILFSNIVVTSPSIDLDPKHLPLTALFLNSNLKPSKDGPRENHHLISRLLPKASIKFSVHEPVIRVSLPPMEPEKAGQDDFDLLISSNSSISLDIESSHSAAGELHYSVTSNVRIASHQLYYQTFSGARHNLSMTDSLELKVQLTANPEVYVVANGNIQSFSVHLMRPEISEGLHQIVRQLKSNVQPKKVEQIAPSSESNFLRKFPPWLLQFQLRGSNFGIEVAGVDPDISKATRGIALQLESWNTEYHAQKAVQPRKRPSRHRATSHVTDSDESLIKLISSSATQKDSRDSSDGRRLALHVHGFEGFVVESPDRWEPESFFLLPKYEVAFSSTSDGQGPIFHVNMFVKTLFVHVSLYRYYAIGMAVTVLKRAFASATIPTSDTPRRKSSTQEPLLPRITSDDVVQSPVSASELLVVDVRAGFIQVKATMPADPPMMLRIYSLDAGRHRWTSPFFKAHTIRIFAEAPKMKKVWARVTSAKHVRVDLRESRRKVSSEYHSEQSIDVSADGVRLSVPHQLVVHRLFDNCVNAAKAVQQLHHRFKTGTNEYILQKYPEGPKHVRRISLRSRAFLFEMEDSPFEWKLSTIYRVGLTEQKQRLARDQAFEAKLAKIREADLRKGSSRVRAQSSHPRGKSQHERESPGAKSGGDRHNRPRSRSVSPPSRGRQKMRYDPEGKCHLTDSARISKEEARTNLDRHNAQSWRRRIDFALSTMKRSMKDIRGAFWGRDETPEVVEEKEQILSLPQRPGLVAALISDLHLVIDKPSFPVRDYAKFLHKVGKGMPFDTKYSLLIPMGVQLDMGETRVALRDYPLPLLHVPPLRSNQSSRLPSFSLKTDFVIAEEYRDGESTRHVQVDVIPVEHCDSVHHKGRFAIDVRRTVSPVKTYSDVKIEINTGHATRIAWGTSYQPAIQDMMMIIETFTKPQVDPSDRTGFWDKIRLSVHSRINVAWKGDGDVHLLLKGSRDPYVVTGYGAGFVMCWRNDVRWCLSQDDDPRKFMTVDSGEYVLAIPDYSNQARSHMELDREVEDGESLSSTSSFKNGALFKKVIMKLSGNVRWLAGLVFERDLPGGARSFDFKPHYDITLKNPEFAKAPQGKIYDAFEGFRSHFIHLSIAVIAPENRDWSATNLKPSLSYNTVHLTPRFFTHFFDWWSLFSGVMSLPIRQGSLWPGVEKSSKKFGRHLATIKYNLLLSPLFMSHIYKHKDAEDYGEDLVSATGLKIRLDSFMLDLHQRREEFTTKIKGRKNQMKTSSMRINQAQLAFISADIRAISASIAGTSAEELKRATDESLASYQQAVPTVDMSRFTIPDNDFSWIDMDDFVELDWILPADSNPETKIIPLAFAPRFTYFRQTDHQDESAGNTTRSSPFGNEPTHYCVMSQDNDPRRVQCDLIQERLDTLETQIAHHKRSLGDAELKLVRDATGDPHLKSKYEELKTYGDILEKKKNFLQSMLKQLDERLQSGYSNATPDGDHENDDIEYSSARSFTGSDPLDSAPLGELASDFNNRFIIHNMQMKWNNTLRNIILRYIHQVSQRRGFIYYMSRRAVKFILDIVEEQGKSKANGKDEAKRNSSSNRQAQNPSAGDDDSESNVEDRIQQLLGDANKFVSADDPALSNIERKATKDNMGENIAREYTPLNSYHVRLIAPQIQLQSEKNAKSAVLMTVESMQLKVIQIMDKDRVADDVSGLVQRRFSAAMESMQCFVTNQKTFTTQLLQMFSGSRYGTPQTSSWPPWVPLEVMFDFETNPFGFSRLVQKTSASLRYDKYNTLRLKYNDEVSGSEAGYNQDQDNPESRIDHIYVEFPTVRAVCDSSQYYAIYIIILDLLLYSEPLEKVRSERLEKIMLASDFSDLRGTPEMVTSLQERIRQIEEIKMHFQLNAKYLDRRGWEDRLSIERDLAGCEDELFFMMKAISTSQRKFDDRSQANGLLKWHLSASELVWHLQKERNESLVEFQLQNAAYDRTDNSDGSNHNSMQIERIRGLNLLPDALYPQMIAPYLDNSRSFAEVRETKMLRVYWYMLEAIAGIPVMDHFEVNLFPLKIQLEREIGKKLFEYIFPGMGSNAFDSGGFSPFMVKHMPAHNEGDDSDEGLEQSNTYVETAHVHDTHARNGTLESRLKPTLTLDDSNRPSTPKPKANHGPTSEPHHFRLFQSQHRSRSSTHLPVPAPQRKTSSESLKLMRRPSNDRSTTSLSSMSQAQNIDRPKKFALRRSMSKDRSSETDGKTSDDLTQMMARASNYMTLAYVKIPSVVLCLSYKDRGERNIRDLHDFVFRMPILEYRNKTWSNLDLALHLKKDVIKALISHTGAIIGNKFAHHRPNRQQQSKLREVANSHSLLSSGNLAHDDSSTTSFQASTTGGRKSTSAFSVGQSSDSGKTEGNLTRNQSYSSSIRSAAVAGANNSSLGSSPHAATHEEAEAEGNGDDSRGFMHNTLSRHLTGLSQKARHREGIADESEESNRRKSAILLGKKILNHLN